MTSRPARVVFLVHLIEAWDSVADVIDIMERADDFEPIVISIPRRFNGETEFSFEEHVHRFLDEERVAHQRITVDELDDGLDRLRALAPDLVFRQSQWDDDVPPAFSSEQLRSFRTALIPYETMNIVDNLPQPGSENTALDSAYHRRAWAVFCTNELVRDEARRSSSRHGEQFHVVGHPKADRLRNAQPSWPAPREPRTEPATRIAWSAHHSIATNWTGFGAFPEMAGPMLHWAQAAPHQAFTFLPHPALRPFCNRPESPITGGAFDAWHDEWSALANTATSTHGRYAPVLAASDLLVTDGLSLLVEYQLFAKPLIYFERAGHRPFNRIGELVRQGAHTVTIASDLPAVATKLLTEPDVLAQQQRENVALLFGDTPAAPRIVATVRAGLAAEGIS